MLPLQPLAAHRHCRPGRAHMLRLLSALQGQERARCWGPRVSLSRPPPLRTSARRRRQRRPSFGLASGLLCWERLPLPGPPPRPALQGGENSLQNTRHWMCRCAVTGLPDLRLGGRAAALLVPLSECKKRTHRGNHFACRRWSATTSQVAMQACHESICCF